MEYIIGQLARVTENDAEYKRTIQIKSTAGSTNNIKITDDEFRAIMGLLIHMRAATPAQIERANGNTWVK